MAKLGNKVFWKFVVSLPEAGDVEGMQKLLERHPAHRNELLNGIRQGVDDGDYSALRYATWLCQFEAHQSAKKVVSWLLTQGHSPDIWTALALQDESSFREALTTNPELVEANHPLFDHPIMEMAPARFRNILVEHGADATNIFNRILLGDIDGARAMVESKEFIVDDGPDTSKLLDHAMIWQQDEFACFLFENGASSTGHESDDFSPIMMACLWGCENSLRAILAKGVDPTVKPLKQSLLTWNVCRSKPSAGVVDLLLKAGVPIPAGRFEGQTLLQTARKRGLDDIVKLLEEAKTR